MITWADLESTALSERSRSCKTTLCGSIDVDEMPGRGRSIEKKSRLVVAQGWRVGIWEVTVRGCEVSFWSDKNIPKLW